MAEIKSTMDLVMERTRHLSMTDAEKKEKKREEAAARIQGLVLNLMDGTIRSTEADRRFEEIKVVCDGIDPLPCENMLRQALFDNLAFDRDNTSLLRLLETRFNIDSEPFDRLFDEYGRAVDAAKQDRLNRARQDLAANRMISGPAVIPNPAADTGWNRVLTEIREQFLKRLEKEKTKAAALTAP